MKTTITRRINEAAELMQIQFVDHTIVATPAYPGTQPYFSFREGGLI